MALPVAATGAEERLLTACQGAALGSGLVRSVEDGRSFVLDDGREVRLAGIEVPLLLYRDGRTFEVTVKSGDRNRFLKGPSLH